MQLPKIDDLHELMCQALRNAGGQDCESALPIEQGKRVADIWFPTERVIVEVKHLGADRNKTDSVRRKTAEILLNGAPSLVPKEEGVVFSVPMQSIPPDMRQGILMHLGNRIRKEVLSANQQIESTVERLGVSDAKGLLIFIVPAHFTTDASVIATVLGRAMRGNSRPFINQILVIETPTEGELPPMRQLALLPITRGGIERLPPLFIEKVVHHWLSTLRAFTGDTLVVLPGGDFDYFGRAKLLRQDE